MLAWPIKSAKIGRDFGENKNDKTKTVTLNYGVDIIARDSKEVFAVARRNCKCNRMDTRLRQRAYYNAQR
ncbi:MAG: hypothetical protein H6613_01900 [Ignavibacteriales bacterium]|nr:hypothetical protein [Ignavibacteriales bacterium]